MQHRDKTTHFYFEFAPYYWWKYKNVFHISFHTLTFCLPLPGVQTGSLGCWRKEMWAGKNREGVVTVGIEGALFPIRSPFQATHHYLHSIVEQANVLPLCIRERNKQQRRRRLSTRPGGTPVFKWQGWSKRGKNQNPNKSLGLPKKILA